MNQKVDGERMKKGYKRKKICYRSDLSYLHLLFCLRDDISVSMDGT